VASGGLKVPSPLRLEELTKSFGRLEAVHRVSLTVAAGERHAILGPNGAGKTTLFNLVAGVHQVTSGRIFLFDEEVSGFPEHSRAAMGLARTFQVTNLFQSLTMFENILLASQAQEHFRYNFFKPLTRYPELIYRVEKILDEWDLQDKRDVVVSNLSYGEQRQLEVIMALANRPRLLLLDEPTAGLSPSETSTMTRFIRGLDESITILLIEHDMDVVFSIAERVTVMHFGHVIAHGSAEEVKGDPKVTSIYLGEQGERDAEG
jgi:branched-chain amino acid transport system ATP-binding protein